MTNVYLDSLSEIKSEAFLYAGAPSSRLLKYIVSKYWTQWLPPVDPNLVQSLLDEELEELSLGVELRDPLEILDGLCDSVFVMAQTDSNISINGIDYYLKLLSAILKTDVTWRHFIEAFCIVCASNYTKLNIVGGTPSPVYNDVGKVQKPHSFVDAKPHLEVLLDDISGGNYEQILDFG